MKYISGVFALIIGAALYEQIDFENLKFEKTGLAIIYIIGLAISLYFFVKTFQKPTEKQT